MSAHPPQPALRLCEHLSARKEAPGDWWRPLAPAATVLRCGGVSWGDDDVALVYESWWKTRRSVVSMLSPARPEVPPLLPHFSLTIPACCHLHGRRFPPFDFSFFL